LTSKILSTLKQRVKGLKLIPGKGGCFELTVDGELVYSKLKTGQFPDEQKILDKLTAKL
jgi:selenoprotein W-related protein